ncbi:MAG: tetratricopeptide repeat protein, partial [Longimicrobiales bacterium]
MSVRVIIGLAGIALLVAVSPAHGQQKPEDLLQSARYAEEVEGDLTAAVRVYQSIISDFPAHRSVAATALLRLGRAYETLGEGEAQQAYERVLRDYPDQQEQVATARTRLAALVRPAAPTNPSGIVVRQVWTGPDVDVTGGPSLDGRYLSYVDWETGDLAIRDLFTGEKRRLTSRAPGESAFYSRISPDGQHVAYVWVDQENPYHLRVTSIDDVRNGVEPRVLVRNTRGYMEFGDWSPDGQSLVANIRGIDLISVSDGTMTTLKTPNWGRPNPRFSPDGQWIVYNVRPQQDSPDRDIFVLAADGSRETPLIEHHPGDDFVLGWAPDGKRILFASNRSGVLSAWVIAVEDGKPRGAPELVKPDIGNIVPMGFTRTGAFYYGTSTGMSDVYTATLDPATGRVVTPPAPVSPQFQGRGSSPAWSPDGEFVAYLSNRRAAANVARGPRVICIR